MKKLLIVTDAWFPQVNGVVTVFDRMAKLLGERGIAVSIAHPELFGWRFPLPLYPEVPLVLFPNSEMRNLFIREKPDYVHIATEWTLGLSARKICLDNSIPFTTSYHTNFPLYAAHYFRYGYLLAPLASRYMRWFHRAAQTMLVSTPSLQRQLLSEGFRNVHVWPFGIDTVGFTRSTRTPEELRGLSKPLFLYFGRVGREKGIEEFLALQLPGTKLVVGDGPVKQQLEHTYKDAVFVGYRRGQELVDFISAADVFVFPSRTETFGLTVLEALSCGVPVAAHDVLGPRDTITHDVDGYLSEDLREAALKCLELSKDDCRKKALHYSWENSAEVFLHYIERTPLSFPASLRRTRTARIMNRLSKTVQSR
jgi:glycosyltransferase involved in cell wall biosynthesis